MTKSGLLSSAKVTARSYTPFGEQIGEATSGFGYNGEYYNAATGMIYLRARFYAPEMNRFSQKDTLRGSITDGVSLNRYLYCQSDPVNFKDADGRRMVNVDVTDSGSGGAFRYSQTYYNYVAEGQRLVNEAQQNAQQAKVAWQRAEAYAPGSSFARQALNSWNQAKEAAHTASTNLSRLQNASTASGAGAYLANIRQAAGTARNEKYNAQLYADRASNYGMNSTGSGITVDAPSVQDVTRNRGYSCGGAATTVGTTSSFLYGLINSINESVWIEEAARLIKKAADWMEKGSVNAPVTQNLEQAAQYGSLARRAFSLSKAASVAGLIVDFVYQLATNESKTEAVVKTSAHFIIGYGVATAVSAAVLSVSAPVAVGLVALGVVATVIASNIADYSIDRIEERTGVYSRIDNAISDFFNWG